MKRTHAERVADVARIVDAARSLVADRASVAPNIVRSTGLSEEGVELGFTRHVEVDPTDAELDRFVESAGDAKHVAVILSANVFVAALRAIAMARAASPAVIVRPSRREPHFARALVDRAKDPGLRLVDEVDVPRLFGGEIHVYGRDETIRAVRAQAGERIRVRGHGAGMGAAVVTSGASIELAAGALADDVVPFDQRGCLSPRVAIVEGDDARANAFAAALDRALADRETKVPRGTLAEDERVDAARYAETVAFTGRVWKGAAHTVGVGPLAIPPPGRHLHVIAAPTLEAARAVLDPLASIVVAIGSDDLARIAAIAPLHARRSALGEMQRPRLDGPVDRR